MTKKVSASYLFLKDPETIFSQVRRTKETAFNSKHNHNFKTFAYACVDEFLLPN